MNKEGYTPYVVSADVYGSFKAWAETTGYGIPEYTYFQGILMDLKAVLSGYFPDVDIVPEDYLRTGLRMKARENENPIISLDQVYMSPGDENIAGFLSISRSVRPNLTDSGLVSKTDVDIDTQIQRFGTVLRGKPITLLDDVVFGGKTIQEIISRFRRQGIPVTTVISGIAIQEGIDLLAAEEIAVESLVVYNEVVDEICERDFVLGTPNSGRTIIINGKRYGAPYLLPFGKPNDWANIPKTNEKDFSLFCIAQSIALWQKIEKESQSAIPTAAISKPIFGLPENRSITAALIETKSKVQERGSV